VKRFENSIRAWSVSENDILFCSCFSHIGVDMGDVARHDGNGVWSAHSKGDLYVVTIHHGGRGSGMALQQAVEAIHSEDTHEHLVIWGDWNRRDSPLYANTRNVIDGMMLRAREGTERDNPNTPDDFTFDIECTDKVIARLKLSKYDKRLIRVIKHWYLGYQDYNQIADRFKTSEDVVKMLHWAAVSCVGRFRFIVKKDLKVLDSGSKAGVV